MGRVSRVVETRTRKKRYINRTEPVLVDIQARSGGKTGRRVALQYDKHNIQRDRKERIRVAIVIFFGTGPSRIRRGTIENSVKQVSDSRQWILRARRSLCCSPYLELERRGYRRNPWCQNGKGDDAGISLFMI